MCEMGFGTYEARIHLFFCISDDKKITKAQKTLAMNFFFSNFAINKSKNNEYYKPIP